MKVTVTKELDETELQQVISEHLSHHQEQDVQDVQVQLIYRQARDGKPREICAKVSYTYGED